MKAHLSTRELKLHSNQLAVLPTWIGSLSNLQQLGLGHNQLAAVPDSIGLNPLKTGPSGLLKLKACKFHVDDQQQRGPLKHLRPDQVEPCLRQVLTPLHVVIADSVCVCACVFVLCVFV